MGLSFEKLVIIVVLAAFLIGPQRLPLAASKLAALVRRLRTLSDSAKSLVGDELRDDDGNQLDWARLDPRQYDPRRIIREAWNNDESPSDAPPSSTSEPQ